MLAINVRDDRLSFLPDMKDGSKLLTDETEVNTMGALGVKSRVRGNFFFKNVNENVQRITQLFNILNEQNFFFSLCNYNKLVYNCPS